MTDAERALLERCGYAIGIVGVADVYPFVSPPYGNRFVDLRPEIAFVRRVGEDAATALASLTALSGVNHARGVRALWDLDPEAAGTFPRDGAHLEELLAGARQKDIRRHVPEDCR